jgi:hypothetical protein
MIEDYDVIMTTCLNRSAYLWCLAIWPRFSLSPAEHRDRLA